MTRTTILRVGLAGLLLAGALAAGIAGVRLLAPSISSGGVGSLLAGLGLGAVVLVAAGLAAWLILLILQDDRPGSADIVRRRLRVVFSVLLLAAEIGLAWLLIKYAGLHRTDLTWITGTVALLVSGLVIVTWFSGRADFDEDVLTLSPPIVLAEASLGVLSVGLAGDGQPVVAWLLAGLAIAESVAWMLLPEAVRPRATAPLRWVPATCAMAVPAASVIGVVVKFAVAGNVLVASLAGAIGLAVLVFVVWRFELILDVPRVRASSGLPGMAVPALARLVGLVVPLGTVVWAVALQASHPASPAAVRLLGAAAWVVLGAIGLLLIQALATAWLRPAVPGRDIAHAAEEAQRRGVESARDAAEVDWRNDRQQYAEQRLNQERYERDRYDRQRYEREPAYREHEQYLRRQRRRRSRVLAVFFGLASLLSITVRPLGVPAPALRAGFDLARSTGLDVDHTWSRLQLVLPGDVRRELARKNRMVAILRVTAASAICTALAWPISAGVILTGASGGVLAALVLAPLAASGVAVIAARGRLADLYLRRVQAADLYRFDLIKALHLPAPRTDAEFAAISSYLDNPSPSRPIVWADASAGSSLAGDQLPERLAAEVAQLAEQRIDNLLSTHRELLLRDQGELLAQQRAQFRAWLSEQALGPEELARLADQIADRAAAPVSDGLGRRMAQLQEQFTRGLRATLEQVVGESLFGPPLTNFTGYLTLELDRSSEEDPQVGSSGGTVRTSPGHELALLMSVVRNPAAARVASLGRGPDGSFLVLEPFVIEGGRDAPVAQFDAVADCSTLTPRPRRQNLDVAQRASMPFRFKLPDNHGQHELWFQLYQAGRLIQAVAISVQTGPELAATP